MIHISHINYFRKKEREKKKQRKREARERGEVLGPSKKAMKRNTMETSSCQVRVAIDCSFDDLMSEKDIMKLGQQIQYCYSSNRRAQDPMQVHPHQYITATDGYLQLSTF